MSNAPQLLSLLFATIIQSLACTTNAQVIAGGGGHSLLICANSSVQSWGNNGSGELGTGNFISFNAPVAVVGLTGVFALPHGCGAHSLAITTSGELLSLIHI